AFVPERFTTSVCKLESVLCGWRWRSKHVSSDVGTNETGGGRLSRRYSRGNEKRYATHGRKSARYLRGRWRATARRGAEWKSRQRSDCRRCFRREHRSQKVLRVNRASPLTFASEFE